MNCQFLVPSIGRGVRRLTCAEKREEDENVCRILDGSRDVVGQQDGIENRKNDCACDGIDPRSMGVIDVIT